MKRLLAIVFTIIPRLFYAQAWFSPDYIVDGHQIVTDTLLKTGQYSPVGNQFTPNGNLHGLLICVNFAGYDGNINVDKWVNGSVPPQQQILTGITPGGSALNFFYSTQAEFAQYQNDPNVKNISKFYYEMSKGQFRLTMDVYKRNGVPWAVTIDPHYVTSWPEMNYKTIEKIYSEDPNFNWSIYNNHKNWPNYKPNNLNITDSIPDFIIFIYKYNVQIGQYWCDTTYGLPIAPSMLNAFPGQDGSGYNNCFLSSSFNFNGYTFDGCGYTVVKGSSSFNSMFIHEVAHCIFDCPHYAGANQISGSYFFPENGWGMMNVSSGAFYSALGWERWWLDWIDIKSNNQTVNSNILSATDLALNGEYILHDFITSGDVIRIKLPYTENTYGKSQYLWIENHQGLSIFDDRGWVLNGATPPGQFPPSPRGIIAYIEALGDNKSTLYNFHNYLFEDGANGIKYLSPGGRYDIDYNTNSYALYPEAWNNWLYSFNDFLIPNPIAGQSFAQGIMKDYNNNDTIIKSFSTNFGPNPLEESAFIWIKNNNFTYDFIQHNYNFPINSKIGLSSNPVLVNYPKYSIQSGVGNYYLNGISFQVIEQNPDNSIKIKILFNDISITNDIRYCGKIILPDITADPNPDLIVSTGKTLTIDKSSTPNRDTKLNGVFVNPTVFICDTNSYVEIQQNAIINVINESQMVFKTGSTLKLKTNAQLIADSTSKIELEPGVNIILEENARILIKAGANFRLAGANIIAGLNSKIEVYGSFSLIANSHFNMTGSGLLKFAGKTSFYYKSHFNMTGSGFLKFDGETSFHNIASFIVEGNDINAPITINSQDILSFGSLAITLRNAKVIFETTMGEIKCKIGTIITAENVLFTAPAGQKFNYGLNLYSPSHVNITNCVFEHGKTGISIINTTGMVPQISACTFDDMRTCVALNGGSAAIDECSFLNSNMGISALNMDHSSTLSGCMFNANTTGMYFRGITSASLYLTQSVFTNGTDGLVAEGPVEVFTRCCSFSSNTNTGVNLKNGSMIEATETGFSGNLVPVMGERAMRFDFNRGMNSFEYSGNGAVMAGTFCKTGNLKIPVNQNYWNRNGTSPEYGVDYNNEFFTLTDCELRPNDIILTDDEPLRDFRTCEMPEGLMGMQVFSQPDNLVSEALTLLSEAMQLMELENAEGNDQLAFEKLHKIVTTPKYYQTAANLKVVEKAYDCLRRTLGHLVQAQPQVAGQHIQKAIQAAHFMQSKLQGNYRVKFNTHIDKAHYHLLDGKYQQAIQILTQMQSWTLAADEPHRASELCFAQMMADMANGQLAETDPEALLQQCNCQPSWETGSHSNADNQNNDHQDVAATLSINPNPTAGNVTISATLPVNSQGGVLYIHDLTGNLKQQFTLQPGANTLTTRKTQLGTGIFNVTVFVNAAKAAEARLSVTE